VILAAAKLVAASFSLITATAGAAVASTPVGHLPGSPAKGGQVGFTAVGEIHPSQHPKWCLSVTAEPPARPGDRIFIAECGEHGTRQQWVATRIHGLGMLQVLGVNPPLAATNNGDLAIVANPDKVSPFTAGLEFTPRGRYWEVLVPWYHLRPLSTATRLRGGVHYTVFWRNGGDLQWIFPKWEEVR
jgi:hypothetical protein